MCVCSFSFAEKDTGPDNQKTDPEKKGTSAVLTQCMYHNVFDIAAVIL